MTKISHKEVFDLLIKEVIEAYPQIQDKSDFISKDILDNLLSDSNLIRERLRKGSFLKDDGQINQTEAFLLTWIHEVWDVKNGNKELYEKFISDLNGTPQKFDLYDKEVPQ